ncbi:hypothetical protein [Dyadobacter luteus]|nr:hypothetical protein [Dyadobacter luteus]
MKRSANVLILSIAMLFGLAACKKDEVEKSLENTSWEFALQDSDPTEGEILESSVYYPWTYCNRIAYEFSFDSNGKLAVKQTQPDCDPILPSFFKAGSHQYVYNPDERRLIIDGTEFKVSLVTDDFLRLHLATPVAGGFSNYIFLFSRIK